MARFVADQNKVLFIYESGTYASVSGTGQWVGIVTESNLVDSPNVESIRYLGGATRNVSIRVDGPLDHEGTLTFHPQDWKFLQFALGSNVDAGSPSPYSHTISETNNNVGNAFTSGTLLPFLSFTVEDSQTSTAAGQNFVRTANGCIIDTLEITAAEGEIIECEATYVPQSVAFSSGTATAVTAATTRPFLWQDVKVHIPSGTVFNEVKEMTLSINNNLSRPHYLNGSRVIAVPQPQNRDYELALTLDATSERTKSLYDQFFRGGSQFNVLLEISDSTAGAGSRDCFISLSGCKLTEMETPSTNEETNEQEITIVPQSASAVIADLIEKYNIY